MFMFFKPTTTPLLHLLSFREEWCKDTGFPHSVHPGVISPYIHYRGLWIGVTGEINMADNHESDAWVLKASLEAPQDNGREAEV